MLGPQPLPDPTREQPSACVRIPGDCCRDFRIGLPPTPIAVGGPNDGQFIVDHHRLGVDVGAWSDPAGGWVPQYEDVELVPQRSRRMCSTKRFRQAHRCGRSEIGEWLPAALMETLAGQLP